jgi:hypothetical protein
MRFLSVVASRCVLADHAKALRPPPEKIASARHNAPSSCQGGYNFVSGMQCMNQLRPQRRTRTGAERSHFPNMNDHE